MEVNNADKNKEKEAVTKILIIDDEDRFRIALASQLENRGFKVFHTNNGEDSIKIVRHENPEVVMLDQKMPNMDGIQTLKEIKKIRPEVQVIMHTGHGCLESAMITGKHDLFAYIEKPCELKELIKTINAAKEERINAMARHEIPEVKKSSFKEWFFGVQNARPGIILTGAIIFLLITFMPTPQKLSFFLTTPKTGEGADAILGYADYKKLEKGETVAHYYAKKAKLYKKITHPDGKVEKALPNIEKIELRAKAMIGILVISAFFWATGAIPIGITAMLAAALIYFFGILPPTLVAKSYAKDSVVFIFGVLAFAAALSKTGLDRRIGIILLGTSSTLIKFGLIFAPLLAVSASFLSEHALVAFIAPILMIVYLSVIKTAGLKKDKNLIVFFMLMLTFVANIGGPGSPAAGGRNAVMIGILSDYNISISFGQWVKMGLPFVPVMAVIVASYFLLRFRKKINFKTINIAREVKKETKRIGKMTKDEYKSAIVLVVLIVLWITLSDKFGMGGPVIAALVALNILGILRWKDISGIHWDVVALYAAASGIGYGLAITGAALWLANFLISFLPDFLMKGTGLCVSASIITGILTNFMSDGATVAAVGPITIPMAALSDTSPVMVGLATAFSSSFAHILIIGTPNNAIVYSLARDPETGEQLVTMKDFFIHGSMVFLLSMIVLCVWVFYGYWQWL
ncbi:MAG: anion permease [Deltaproteobacteria bacterium]|nr:anion permease [Deltaproteobacteria bacterium]